MVHKSSFKNRYYKRNKNTQLMQIKNKNFMLKIELLIN